VTSATEVEGPLESTPQRRHRRPGATRANGVVNPEYEHTFVPTNDFAAHHPAGS
jgi:hypothetical protein